MSYGNPNSPSSSPYNSGGYLSDPPPKKSSNTLLWVLGILGVLGLGGLAVCCGGGYMMYSWGTNMIAQEMQPRIENDPAVQEHIGEIQSMSFDFGATQQRQADEVMVFSVSGTKGSGQVEIADVEGSQSCVLILADGRRFDIALQEEEWSEEDFGDGTVDEGEIDMDEGSIESTEAVPTEDTSTIPSTDSAPANENTLPASEPVPSL